MFLPHRSCVQLQSVITVILIYFSIIFHSLAFTNCSVMEGTIGPIDNCTIRANDVDSGKNGNVSYHIANSKVRFFVLLRCIILFSAQLVAGNLRFLRQITNT